MTERTQTRGNAYRWGMLMWFNQLLLEQGAGTEKLVLRSVGTTLPSQGSTVELRHALGLDAEGIAQAVREVLA